MATIKGHISMYHEEQDGEPHAAVDAPALPEGTFQACVFFWHRTPTALSDGFVKMSVEPGDRDDSPPRLRLSLTMEQDDDGEVSILERAQPQGMGSLQGAQITLSQK
jgi:hypothetical protein